MTVRPQVGEIKNLVVRTFLELGVPTRQLFGLEELASIRDGRCVAKTYRAAGLEAVWLIAKGVIRFHDAEGNTLRVIHLYQEIVPQTMAA